MGLPKAVLDSGCSDWAPVAGGQGCILRVVVGCGQAGPRQLWYSVCYRAMRAAVRDCRYMGSGGRDGDLAMRTMGG